MPIMKCNIAVTAFNMQKNFCTSKLNLNVRKKPTKCYICSTALCGAETWTLRRAEKKYLESFETWCWSGGEGQLDRPCGSEEVLCRVKEARNSLHTIKRRKVNWNGYFVGTNCLLKNAVEGKIEGRIKVTRGREKRRKQLLNGTAGYWNLKKEALLRTMWITRFGKGYGPVARRTAG